MSNIPPSKVAHSMLHCIDSILNFFGISHDSSIEEAIYIICVISLALFLSWIIRLIILSTINHIPNINASTSNLLKQGELVIKKATLIIPPIFLLVFVPFAFATDSIVLKYIMNLSEIYLVVMMAKALNALFNFIWHRYDERNNTQNHPLKGLLQVAKGIIWIIAVIIIIGTIINKSPLALLTGLGAFAAVLMLIFKDSILGLVAGVQLSQNDMLREGDWIVVPDTPANGVVEEVSLTVVKVRNWDNTLAMLPPYSLVSSSFQNWRGMSETGTRLINHTFNVAIDSVACASPELLDSLKNLGNIKFSDFINIKLQQEADNKVVNTNNPSNIVNGTISTNLGLFRAYLTIYLQSHHLISQSSFLMISELSPTPQGIPLQIYCYTATTDWASFESIKCEIFEHVAAMMPMFNLYPFEFPSGKNVADLLHLNH